jgi:hypothetical protein
LASQKLACWNGISSHQLVPAVSNNITFVNALLNACTSGMWLSLLLFSVCATTPTSAADMPAPELPAEVTINQDAGCGGLLVVTLRLESGEEVPCAVDTGSEGTVFDKSLETKLGKRLDTTRMWNFGVKHKSAAYATPKLYLGSTLLRTGNTIFCTDLKQMLSGSDHPIKGILGMDCLHYYCIQLDFDAGKMRFLPPEQVDAAKLGKAFPMTLTSYENSEGDFMRAFISFGSLIGGKGTNLLVDTGYEVDGALESGLFRRSLLEQRLRAEGDAAGSQASGFMWFRQCVWNGATYTNLLIGNGGSDFKRGNGENLIGLRFLARHLVTFDFPTRALYLKQRIIGPLAAEKVKAATEFLTGLKHNNQLPGWSSDDKGTLNCDANANPEAFYGRKSGDETTYHYVVARASRESPWKLIKAWRTDYKNHIIETYQVP